jgi:hypothetical protein
MSQIAEDHIQRHSELVIRRSDFDKYWQQVHEVAAPDATDFRSIAHTTTSPIQIATTARASRKMYDSTAVWCVDRLASGIEALIVPQSDYWHGYSLTDFTKEQETDEERLFLERLRNLTFKLRYDADTGWIPAIQTAIRRCIAFGNAFVMVEEGWDRRALFRYRYIPLAECYVDENHFNQIDYFCRYYTLTARQAVQKFGADKVSTLIRRNAENPTAALQKHRFLQCIGPRGDYGLPSAGVRNAPWYSIHVDIDAREIVGESGFYEMPIIDFRWMPEPGRVYGEGPVMKCLSDIQSINRMARNELVANEQAHNPPLLVADAGVVNRPNAAPGAITYGGLNAQGQRRVEPLFNSQRLDFATMVLEAKRNQVKESMYINLFALLVQNPQMSATEAMIRSNEKGELLGPAGSRLQQSLANLNERELGIMERRGIFRREQFQPPRSMAGANIGASFSSPLDRARKGKEVEGTMNLLNVLSPIAQIDPSVLDNLDGEQMIRGLAERMGVPVSFVRDLRAVAQIRQERADQQAQAQNAAIAKDAAAASKAGVEALSGMQQMGAV